MKEASVSGLSFPLEEQLLAGPCGFFRTERGGKLRFCLKEGMWWC